MTIKCFYCKKFCTFYHQVQYIGRPCISHFIISCNWSRPITQIFSGVRDYKTGGLWLVYMTQVCIFWPSQQAGARRSWRGSSVSNLPTSLMDHILAHFQHVTLYEVARKDCRNPTPNTIQKIGGKTVNKIQRRAVDLCACWKHKAWSCSNACIHLLCSTQTHTTINMMQSLSHVGFHKDVSGTRRRAEEEWEREWVSACMPYHIMWCQHIDPQGMNNGSALSKTFKGKWPIRLTMQAHCNTNLYCYHGLFLRLAAKNSSREQLSNKTWG